MLFLFLLLIPLISDPDTEPCEKAKKNPPENMSFTFKGSQAKLNFNCGEDRISFAEGRIFDKSAYIFCYELLNKYFFVDFKSIPVDKAECVKKQKFQNIILNVFIIPIILISCFVLYLIFFTGFLYYSN